MTVVILTVVVSTDAVGQQSKTVWEGSDKGVGLCSCNVTVWEKSAQSESQAH